MILFTVFKMICLSYLVKWFFAVFMEHNAIIKKKKVRFHTVRDFGKI